MAMQDDVGAAPRAAQGLRELQPLETNLPLSADAARALQAGTAEAEAEDPAAPWPQRPFRRGWRFNWPGVGIMVVYCLAFIFYLYIRIRYTLDLGAYVWCGLQKIACASVPVESPVRVESLLVAPACARAPRSVAALSGAAAAGGPPLLAAPRQRRARPGLRLEWQPEGSERSPAAADGRAAHGGAGGACMQRRRAFWAQRPRRSSGLSAGLTPARARPAGGARSSWRWRCWARRPRCCTA